MLKVLQLIVNKLSELVTGFRGDIVSIREEIEKIKEVNTTLETRIANLEDAVSGETAEERDELQALSDQVTSI